MIAVLVVTLLELTKNTTSGDVIELTIWSAKDTCARMGIDETTFNQMVGNFKKMTDPLRARSNPYAY